MTRAVLILLSDGTRLRVFDDGADLDALSKDIARASQNERHIWIGETIINPDQVTSLHYEDEKQ